MAETDKTKDQFGTYSKHVGEWTTGSGGGAGSEKTHIHPVKEEDSTIDENRGEAAGERIDEENKTASSSGNRT